MTSYKIPVLLIASNFLHANTIKKGLGENCEVAHYKNMTDAEDYLHRSFPALILTDIPFLSVTGTPTFILGEDITQPYTEEKLTELLDKHAIPYMTTLLLTRERDALLEENEVLKKKTEAQSAYLKKAGEVQKGMLKSLQYEEHDVTVATKFLPLMDLSGDFYYYKRFGNFLYFVIGDVVDHGAEAAIYMTELTSFLYVLLQKEAPLPELLQSFNYLGRHYNHCGLSATAFFGKLDLATGELEYCSIAHDMPYVVGEEVKQLTQEVLYLPVGFNELNTFKTSKTAISVNEKVFLYTDGLTEEFNSASTDITCSYGEKCLLPVLTANKDKNAFELCNRITEDMLNYIAGNEQNDDVLILCIGRTEAGV